MSKKKTVFSKPHLKLNKDKRMVVISDLHCGHLVGLTPPQFQGKFIDHDIAKHNKLVRVQKSMWDFFSSEIIKLQKEKDIDLLVCNGDAIDGEGWRSGGAELITTDRTKQVSIAKSVIDFVDAKKIHIVSGTPYHCGSVEEYEGILAEQLDCKYENHCWLDINGQVFDFKHHCASSSVPHGRYTPIAKEAMWAKLWGERKLIPQNVKYLIRSHVHYHSLISDSEMSAMTTPALQGFGSRYGAKVCSGTVDIGFISFDISASGAISMKKHFIELKEQAAKATIY